jgi:hypothetical protein
MKNSTGGKFLAAGIFLGPVLTLLFITDPNLAAWNIIVKMLVCGSGWAVTAYTIWWARA